MRSKENIKKLLSSKISFFEQKYKVQSLSIFGSYSRDEQTNDSDIDILVEFDSAVGLEFLQLAEELENLLGLKVDLVSKNGIKPKYFSEIEHDLIHV